LFLLIKVILFLIFLLLFSDCFNWPYLNISHCLYIRLNKVYKKDNDMFAYIGYNSTVNIKDPNLNSK